MRIVPFTLSQANDVMRLHRHHKPAHAHRFSIGLKDKQEQVRGAAISGRPKAWATKQYEVLEVTRLVTDGAKNACSALYSACARIAKEMGFERIQTFILQSESGVSLRASGWHRIQSDGTECDCAKGCEKCMTTGGDWNRKGRDGRRSDQPQEPKQRWGRWLEPPR